MKSHIILNQALSVDALLAGCTGVTVQRCWHQPLQHSCVVNWPKINQISNTDAWNITASGPPLLVRLKKKRWNFLQLCTLIHNTNVKQKWSNTNEKLRIVGSYNHQEWWIHEKWRRDGGLPRVRWSYRETKPLGVFSAASLTGVCIVWLMGAPPHRCNREEWWLSVCTSPLKPLQVWT